MLVAGVAVAATTLAIYPLGAVAPEVSLGVVYLLAVLLISTYWGLGLGLLTAVAGAATFNWFHIAPTGRFHVADERELGGARCLPGRSRDRVDRGRGGARRGRPRRSGAGRRPTWRPRWRARCSAAPASTTRCRARPGSSPRRSSCASRRSRPGSPSPTASRCRSRSTSARRGRPPCSCRATSTRARGSALTERVVPSLEALLAAALDRERLQREVVETQALRHSDVLKTALLRAVSHDLRTPLTTIMAAGDAVRSPTLRAGGPGGAGVDDRRRGGAPLASGGAAARPLAAAGGRGRAAARLVLARGDRRVRGRASDRRDGGIPIELAIDRGLPFIEADAAQLERVFVNLLDNARRFSGGRPVEVQRAGGRRAGRGPGDRSGRGDPRRSSCRTSSSRSVAGRTGASTPAPGSGWPSSRGWSRRTAAGCAWSRGSAAAPSFSLEFPVPAGAAPRRCERTMSARRRVLVVDDELQILRALEGRPARGRLRGGGDGHGARCAGRRGGAAARGGDRRPDAPRRRRDRRLLAAAVVERDADPRAVGDRRGGAEGRRAGGRSRRLRDQAVRAARARRAAQRGAAPRRSPAARGRGSPSTGSRSTSPPGASAATARRSA